MNEPAIVLAATATKLPEAARGGVLVTGSHGGVYPGKLAAQAGVRGAIFHDAGIGLGEAGIGSLALLGRLGIAAAAVSHMSARVGDTEDMMARGVISRANPAALAVGVARGMPCAEAARLLRAAPWRQAPPPEASEGRWVEPQHGRRKLVLIDSAAMVLPEDAGAVIVTGSHGGLVGGVPAMALRVDGFAAAFNDAGIGIEQAGIGRLPALDARGIAAITVSAGSARIGQARSTFEDGVISAVNARAAALGARVGDRARDVLLRWTTEG